VSDRWQDEARRLHALAAAGEESRQPIADAILAASGDGLRRLMLALDTQGDHRDLEWMVYELLGDVQRDAVLAHIAAQSRDWPAERHVVVDVDDTLFSSIHDAVYPVGTLYPGVLEFLARCGGGTPVIVVTARPEGQAGVFEDRLRRRLDGYGLTSVAVLSGRLLQVFTDAAMAARKGANLDHLMALHPVDRFVLVGDDGQGDVMLAHQAIKAWGDRIAGVFIHHVAEGAVATVPGISFFSCYAEAARQARTLGLLSARDAAAVACRARDELLAVTFDSPARERAAREAFNQALFGAARQLALPLPDVPALQVVAPAN